VDSHADRFAAHIALSGTEGSDTYPAIASAALSLGGGRPCPVFERRVACTGTGERADREVAGEPSSMTRTEFGGFAAGDEPGATLAGI